MEQRKYPPPEAGTKNFINNIHVCLKMEVLGSVQEVSFVDKIQET